MWIVFWWKRSKKLIASPVLGPKFSPHLLHHIWRLHWREGFGWWLGAGDLLGLLHRGGGGHLLLLAAAAEGVLLVVHHGAAAEWVLLLVRVEQTVLLLQGSCLEASLLEGSADATNLFRFLLREARQLLRLTLHRRALLSIWEADSGPSLLAKVNSS